MPALDDDDDVHVFVHRIIITKLAQEVSGDDEPLVVPTSRMHFLGELSLYDMFVNKSSSEFSCDETAVTLYLCQLDRTSNTDTIMDQESSFFRISQWSCFLF